MTSLEYIIYIIDKVGFFVVSMTVVIVGFVLLYRGKLGKLEIGRAVKLTNISNEVEEIRHRLKLSAQEGAADKNHQYALLQEYHAQGLAQSKISFWFSLIFAAIGFFIIIISVLSYLLSSGPESTAASKEIAIHDIAGKPIFAVAAGTIIDAVAALFFVQSNKARQLMTEFFDKLRVDRKLDESLNVLSQIEDKAISSRVKALLTLNFAEVKVSDDAFRQLISGLSQIDNLEPHKQVNKDA